MENLDIKSSFVRKRGNNYNVIIEYVDENGKLKQKSLGKHATKKNAEKQLIDLKSSINNKNFILKKDITLVERYKQYIEDETRQLAPYTKYTRNNILKIDIEPFFKDCKLQDVTPALLQAFINNAYTKYTLSSAKNRSETIKTVLREAYRLKEINENPCDFVKNPSKSLKKSECINEPYSREEVKKVIECLEGENIEIPILLMLTLGLRFGEAAGLRWQDIDFKNNTISIRQILVYIKGQGISFKEPKTSGSLRTISVPTEIMLKLKKLKIKHNEYRLGHSLEYEDIVCLNKYLRPFIPPRLNNNWNRFLKKNNIRKIRMHDLRHTHATMLVLAGVDFKTISNRLGHTDIQITLNRYSHVLKEMDYNASENISKIMFN